MLFKNKSWKIESLCARQHISHISISIYLVQCRTKWPVKRLNKILAASFIFTPMFAVPVLTQNQTGRRGAMKPSPKFDKYCQIVGVQNKFTSSPLNHSRHACIIWYLIYNVLRRRRQIQKRTNFFSKNLSCATYQFFSDKAGLIRS